MSFADQLERLQQFLDADDLHDEALDYLAGHGYLTALSISPVEVPEQEWMFELFAEEPKYTDAAQKTDIETTLRELKALIGRILASDEELEPLGGRAEIEGMMLRAARASCDFYIEQTPTCGVPYWDTGAPELHHLGDYLERPADPFNSHEPVDSSAAAIAAQGLLRLGRYLGQDGEGSRYWKAGLAVMRTLLDEPYLSTDPSHHGLLLHVVYHWPRGWDHVPAGGRVPAGESAMWGDYHLREAALYLQRIIRDEPYLTFWGGSEGAEVNA